MMPTAITLPPEAPIMVLPGAVLFPNTMLPLRIFEPRYRAMLDWALEHDRMFCVAMMKPGVSEAKTEAQFFQTAGIGLVAASVTQEDGTSNLMLRGLARVRFTGFPQRKPFRKASFEVIPDIHVGPSETEALVEALRDQCREIRVDGSPLPATFLEIFNRMESAAAISDTVAHALVKDVVQRQHLLEQPDPAERLREITRILARDFTEEREGG